MSFSSLKKSSRDDITQPTHHFKPYPSSAISSYSQNSLPHRRLTSWLPVSSSSQHKNTTVPIPGWFDFFFQVLTKEVVARRPYPARAPLQALSVVGSSSPVFCHLIISESDSPPPRPSIKKVVVRRPSSAHAPSQALSVVESSATRLATSPTSVCSIAATTAISSFPRLPPDSSPDILANLSRRATTLLSPRTTSSLYPARAPLQALSVVGSSSPVFRHLITSQSDSPSPRPSIKKVVVRRPSSAHAPSQALSVVESSATRLANSPTSVCSIAATTAISSFIFARLIRVLLFPAQRPYCPHPRLVQYSFFFKSSLKKSSPDDITQPTHHFKPYPSSAISSYSQNSLPHRRLISWPTFLAKEVVARRPYPARAPLQA
ncbi:hypothetical protein PGTUg99_022996 [Puccinia graminis f. sp. tritici]|uniref:Uncharacterized protein n=1 Tax=Puccinia graminis f. sp. tritici TaxID=56615 RepID=A0A5B0MRF5_PUCGR|nr:hypothetical protein PGTUg99_022996 [Puccinia graminis f. sp. tritici]